MKKKIVTRTIKKIDEIRVAGPSEGTELLFRRTVFNPVTVHNGEIVTLHLKPKRKEERE